MPNWALPVPAIGGFRYISLPWSVAFFSEITQCVLTTKHKKCAVVPTIGQIEGVEHQHSKRRKL